MHASGDQFLDQLPGAEVRAKEQMRAVCADLCADPRAFPARCAFYAPSKSLENMERRRKAVCRSAPLSVC